MTVFTTGYSMGSGFRTSRDSAFLIKSQTDFVYMQTDAGQAAVKLPARVLSTRRSCEWQC